MGNWLLWCFCKRAAGGHKLIGNFGRLRSTKPIRSFPWCNDRQPSGINKIMLLAHDCNRSKVLLTLCTRYTCRWRQRCPWLAKQSTNCSWTLWPNTKSHLAPTGTWKWNGVMLGENIIKKFKHHHQHHQITSWSFDTNETQYNYWCVLHPSLYCITAIH